MKLLSKKHTLTHFKLSCILALAIALLILSSPLAFGQQPLKPEEAKVVERDAAEKAKRVNLNFANAELQVVLKWLADEADLTIIATEGDIKGKKFALMNVKNVTIDEAMEHIKTVMALQGLTLIQTNSTIMVTTLQKAGKMKVPVKDAFFVSEYEQKLQPTDEVITQPILFEYAIASELSGSIKSLLSGTSNILADSNTNALVITDIASNIHKVCKLLAMFDQEPETALKVKIITLENSDARTIAQTLNELFREEMQVTGLLKKMKRAKSQDEMKKMMEEAKGKGGGIDIVSGKVQIVADTSSNSIIVKASDRNIAIIESLIKELDSVQFIEPKLKVFHLEYADAEQIARELEDLIQGTGISRRMSSWQRSDMRRNMFWGRQRRRERGQEQQGGGGVIGDVNIVADSRLNAIMVSTDERNFPFIEMIIKELDKGKTKEEFKIFYLEVADAEQMVTTLQDLIEGGSTSGGGYYSSSYMRYRRRRDRQEWGSPGFGIQGEVNFVAEPRLNAILVSTTAQNLKIVAGLIEELDLSKPGQEWGTKIIQLKNADAENISNIINQVFQGGQSSRRSSFFYWMPRRQRTQSSSALSGNVTVEPYPTLNALIVSASTSRNLEQVEDFIKQLDEPTPDNEREITRIIKLEYADSQQLQQLLDQVWGEGTSSFGRRGRSSFFRSLFSGRSEQRDINSLKGKVEINYDEQTNALVVTSKHRYWKDIMDLIAELDIVRGQVFLDVQILEITLDESTKFGLELDTQTGREFKLWERDDIDKPDKLTGQMNTDFLLGQEISGFRYTLMTRELIGVIHTLMDENKVRVLSRPALLTRDNKEAIFTRFRRIPYLESVGYTGSTGGTSQNNQGNQGNQGNQANQALVFSGQPLYNYDFLDDVGVGVTITPHIAKTEVAEGGKRTIGLDITEIRASNFLGFTSFNAPLTEDSTVSAYIDVEEGQPILIGGMIKSKQQNKEKKLPILGSLPFVGRLFKQSETVVEDSEIVMIITPHIVDIKNPTDMQRLDELRQKNFGDTEGMMNDSMNKSKVRNGNNKNNHRNNKRNQK